MPEKQEAADPELEQRSSSVRKKKRRPIVGGPSRLEKAEKRAHELEIKLANQKQAINEIRERRDLYKTKLEETQERISEMQKHLNMLTEQATILQNATQYRDIARRVVENFIRASFGPLNPCCGRKVLTKLCKKFSCRHILALIGPLYVQLVQDQQIEELKLYIPPVHGPARVPAGTGAGIPGQFTGWDWESGRFNPDNIAHREMGQPTTPMDIYLSRKPGERPGPIVTAAPGG